MLERYVVSSLLFSPATYMYFHVTHPILQNVCSFYCPFKYMYCSSVNCVLACQYNIFPTPPPPPTHTHTQNLYQLHIPYDPEGALGSLNSIVICFLGVQAGRILTRYRDRHVGIIARFSIWGTALVRCYTV